MDTVPPMLWKLGVTTTALVCSSDVSATAPAVWFDIDIYVLHNRIAEEKVQQVTSNPQRLAFPRSFLEGRYLDAGTTTPFMCGNQ